MKNFKVLRRNLKARLSLENKFNFPLDSHDSCKLYICQVKTNYVS